VRISVNPLAFIINLYLSYILITYQQQQKIIKGDCFSILFLDLTQEMVNLIYI